MKVKLLKKIRKKYSIVYYPNGYEPHRIVSVPTYPVYYVSGNGKGNMKDTKNLCLDWIMSIVREDYKKYSRKYDKNKYKGIKVWYNK